MVVRVGVVIGGARGHDVGVCRCGSRCVELRPAAEGGGDVLVAETLPVEAFARVLAAAGEAEAQGCEDDEENGGDAQAEADFFAVCEAVG